MTPASITRICLDCWEIFEYRPCFELARRPPQTFRRPRLSEGFRPLQSRTHAVIEAFATASEEGRRGRRGTFVVYPCAVDGYS